MRPRFLADENVEGATVGALRRRCPGIDILTHLEAGLMGKSDVEVLAFARSNSRILITHDRRIQSVARSTPHCGILLLRVTSLRSIVDYIQLAWEASDSAEWENMIRWLPL